MTSDDPADDLATDELADRLEDVERTTDTVAAIVDDIRDPESPAALPPPPEVDDRLERIEDRLDRLSELVLELAKGWVSEIKSNANVVDDGEEPVESNEPADGDGGTSRGYY